MSKNMTNKGLLLFVVIFFIVMSFGCYIFLYDEDLIQTISVSTISSLVVLLIFVVKRKWDRKQENEFKK